MERDLRSAMRRYSAREQARDDAAAERDRVIRDAHALGMGPTHIAELTDLSNKRIEQIVAARRR